MTLLAVQAIVAVEIQSRTVHCTLMNKMLNVNYRYSNCNF